MTCGLGKTSPSCCPGRRRGSRKRSKTWQSRRAPSTIFRSPRSNNARGHGIGIGSAKITTMKKLIFMAVLSAGILLGFSRAEGQHYYVQVHPTARAIKRPLAPSPRHVWVGSEWSWSNGAYVEVPGHWDLPPNGRRVWVAGHWTKTGRGSY